MESKCYSCSPIIDLIFSSVNGNLSGKKIFVFSSKMFQIKHKICTGRVHHGQGHSGKLEQSREPWTEWRFDVCWTAREQRFMREQYWEPGKHRCPTPHRLSSRHYMGPCTTSVQSTVHYQRQVISRLPGACFSGSWKAWCLLQDQAWILALLFTTPNRSRGSGLLYHLWNGDDDGSRLNRFLRRLNYHIRPL